MLYFRHPNFIVSFTRQELDGSIPATALASATAFAVTRYTVLLNHSPGYMAVIAAKLNVDHANQFLIC